VHVYEEGARALDLTLERTPPPAPGEPSPAGAAHDPSGDEGHEADDKAARRRERGAGERAGGDALEQETPRRVEDLPAGGLGLVRRHGKRALGVRLRRVAASRIGHDA
jgi:hypothetical protein